MRRVAERTIVDLSTNHVELAVVLHSLAERTRDVYLQSAKMMLAVKDLALDIPV